MVESADAPVNAVTVALDGQAQAHSAQGVTDEL